MKVNKILVSQPRPTTEKSPYFDIAEKYGVEVVFRPFIKVEGLPAREFRQQKVSLPDFTAVIFTAKTAIDHFFRLSEEMRFNVPETMKYFCTTKSIADYLQKYTVYRKRKIFKAETGKLVDLLPYFIKHKNEKYLYAVSDVSNAADAKFLDDNKINYTRAVMYRTVSNDFGPDEAFDYDMLAFFSPQGIESLTKNFPEYTQGDTAIATFGANTAKAAREAGLRVDVEAPTPAAPSMTGAIELFLKENQSK
ncbi:MAG: uroporphyrinogen-III synthase [Bacteroidales bacterium]|nr:uroporphyrinogen-III synthase [Bacteroidales bacterium]